MGWRYIELVWKWVFVVWIWSGRRKGIGGGIASYPGCRWAHREPGYEARGGRAVRKKRERKRGNQSNEIEVEINVGLHITYKQEFMNSWYMLLIWPEAINLVSHLLEHTPSSYINPCGGTCFLVSFNNLSHRCPFTNSLHWLTLLNKMGVVWGLWGSSSRYGMHNQFTSCWEYREPPPSSLNVQIKFWPKFS